MLEGSDRQVNGVTIITGRTIILDGHDDAVTIVDVDDLHLLPAEGGGITTITIPLLIHGGNQIVIRVFLAAGPIVTVLVEESGKATEVKVTIIACGRRRWRGRLGVSGFRGGTGFKRIRFGNFVLYSEASRVHRRR